MNELINGLWWKARIGYNNQSCDVEVIEKFAELIVRECVLEAMDAAHHNNSIRLQLYKHFGVE